jgi:hypothetical protein
MVIRAKFSVWSKQVSDGNTQVTLGAVVTGSPENERFFKFTPSATINLNTINETAGNEFEIGDEFCVDFTKCEK